MYIERVKSILLRKVDYSTDCLIRIQFSQLYFFHLHNSDIKIRTNKYRFKNKV